MIQSVIESVCVIGARGRVGSAVAARLDRQGLLVDAADGGLPDVVLLCVPDRAIAEAASSVPEGPWVAHVSGATPLAALAPHARRFGLHPLQTFTLHRGAEQLDGSWAAVTAESPEAEQVGLALACTLGLRPFTIADADRAAYHAGAAIASNFLVTLRRAAGALLASAGAPPEALDPLMRRTIENGFALTGPIDRGDWQTVERHLDVIESSEPELADAYRALVVLTAAQAGRALPTDLLAAKATA